MAAFGRSKQCQVYGERPLILLTVGTQLPFDRLVSLMDRFAEQHGLDVYGQVGVTSFQPKNFPVVRNIPAKDFDAKFRAATLIVAHAGIGTVLTAQKYKKPIILFPRIAGSGEHRNDHQTATCHQLEGRPGIYVAWDETALQNLLVSRGSLQPANDDAVANGRGQFITNLRDYLEEV